MALIEIRNKQTKKTALCNEKQIAFYDERPEMFERVVEIEEEELENDFNGELEDVKVFDKNLTDEEIKIKSGSIASEGDTIENDTTDFFEEEKEKVEEETPVEEIKDTDTEIIEKPKRGRPRKN